MVGYASAVTDDLCGRCHKWRVSAHAVSRLARTFVKEHQPGRHNWTDCVLTPLGLTGERCRPESAFPDNSATRRSPCNRSADNVRLSRRRRRCRCWICTSTASSQQSAATAAQPLSLLSYQYYQANSYLARRLTQRWCGPCSHCDRHNSKQHRAWYSRGTDDSVWIVRATALVFLVSKSVGEKWVVDSAAVDGPHHRPKGHTDGWGRVAVC